MSGVRVVSELSPFVLGSVKGLLSALLVRDPHTAAHQERVGILARRLALRTGLDASHAEWIALAGQVHDVGKLGIPMAVITSPRRLTPRETVIMRSHSIFGAQMLERIGAPMRLTDTVRSHHERPDGSGYPLGLRGPEITIDARVLAVADVMDAMLFARPYHHAQSIDTIVRELERGRGSAYDNGVVDAALHEFDHMEREGRAEDMQFAGCMAN